MSISDSATVIVVHGAWADGSSWEPVIRRLYQRRLNVVAAPIPLTSLSDDAAALRRTIGRTQGPLILAGHAYAGAVIGTAGDERVKALVYVAALAPDEGETGANVFLNIAGAVPQIDLFEMTDEQWGAGMELKLHGARRLTVRAWDALKKAKGSVVFMSGSAALDPKPGFAAVAATNAAIIALAKAFAEQGIKDGVQVNSIVPGAVMTGRRRSFLERWAPAHGMTVEEATKRFPEEAGISRYGQPEEIAELLAFMVSPAARWMTGTAVRMDGGEVKGI